MPVCAPDQYYDYDGSYSCMCNSTGLLPATDSEDPCQIQDNSTSGQEVSCEYPHYRRNNECVLPSCGPEQTFDYEHFECACADPTHKVNGTECSASEKQCSDSGSFFNTTSQKCDALPICASGQIFNLVTQGCEVSHSEVHCNYPLFNRNNECVLPSCGESQIFDYQLFHCKCVDTQMQFNASSGQCEVPGTQDSEVTCEPPKFRQNNKCVECPQGQTFSTDQFKCVCDESQAGCTPADEGSCRDADQQYDPETGMCETVEVKCQKPMYRKNNQCILPPECPPSQEFNYTQHICVGRNETVVEPRWPNREDLEPLDPVQKYSLLVIMGSFLFGIFLQTVLPTKLFHSDLHTQDFAQAC